MDQKQKEHYNIADTSYQNDLHSVIQRKNPQQLISISLDEPSAHVYRPGEELTGSVMVDVSYLQNTQQMSKIDVHLACTFRIHDKYSATDDEKQLIFKVAANPLWVSLPDKNRASFSLTIPSHLPAYNTHDISINGKIAYKLKAIYEMADVPLSFYPKTSIPILISAQIATTDPIYQTPMQSEKELVITVPRDIVLKRPSTVLRKGDESVVFARLCIPQSCFLPGEYIPFSLYIQHIAPIKHAQGIHILLERTTTIISSTPTEKRSNTTITSLSLPLICGLDDYATTITSQQKLKVPENIAPTIRASVNPLIPLFVEYRVRVLINMDMQQLVEEGPQRKRDRAYSFVVAKMIGQQEQPEFLYNTTIELDLPVCIGTTCSKNNASRHHSLPNSLQITPSSYSLSLQQHHLVASPDCHEDTSSVMTNNSSNKSTHVYRFDSDPTFDRCHHGSSANYLSIPVADNVSLMSRPPSAPSLAELMDPPPYI